jgi:hypothetical protein
MMSAKEARQFVGRTTWENGQNSLVRSVLKRFDKEIKRKAASKKDCFTSVSLVVGKKLTESEEKKLVSLLLEYGYWTSSEKLDHPNKVSDYKITLNF